MLRVDFQLGIGMDRAQTSVTRSPGLVSRGSSCINGRIANRWPRGTGETGSDRVPWERIVASCTSLALYLFEERRVERRNGSLFIGKPVCRLGFLHAVMSGYHATGQLASSQLGSYSGLNGWLQLSFEGMTGQQGVPVRFPRKKKYIGLCSGSV